MLDESRTFTCTLLRIRGGRRKIIKSEEFLAGPWVIKINGTEKFFTHFCASSLIISAAQHDDVEENNLQIKTS